MSLFEKQVYEKINYMYIQVQDICISDLGSLDIVNAAHYYN